MKWQGRRGSRNIEDRRGRARSSGASGRAGRRMGKRGAGGIGGLGVIVIVVAGWLLGVDVTPLLQGGGAGFSTEESAPTEADERAAQFVSVVLADTEEVWSDIFARELGRTYRPPVLVLYTGATQSPCGGADGVSGPFYCPADRKAYLDTAFFTTLERRLGAGGDFAAAYVVAHEVAHHVQNELGILGQSIALRRTASPSEANAISVRIELQADCFSGVWARQAQARFGMMERGDLAEALNAARQIGDDTLQANAGRRPNPHTFTHGTSDQRERWFARGWEAGSVGACDTFGTNQL